MKKIVLSSIVLLGSTVLLSACVPGLQNQEQTQQSEKEMIKESNELAQAIESGKPTYCQITSDDGTENLEYWIKDKKMKMVGQGVSGDDEVAQMEMGSMISDGEYIYTWSEGETQGVKFRAMTEEEAQEVAAEAEEYMQDLPDMGDDFVEEYENKGYRVDCKQQNIADSEFTPPANVQFQDMEMIMEQSMQQVRQGMMEGEGMMEQEQEMEIQYEKFMKGLDE